MFAPVSLVVFAIAALVIFASAGGSDKSSSRSDKATKEEQRDLRVKKRRAARESKPRVSRSVYVVQAGDTLGGIAEKTGVSVEALQELNPNVDPQALTSGQRLKLK
jgi:teichoic acid transport system ATP-binding protein